MIQKLGQKRCKMCPTMFTPNMSTDRFCSFQCAMNYANEKRKAKEERTGRKTPRTQSEPPERKKAKAAARKRDFNMCRLYTKLPNELEHSRHTIGLSGHHIIFLSEGVIDKTWNIITLSDHCNHHNAHKYKEKYQWKIMVIANGRDWYKNIDFSDVPDSAMQKIRYLIKMTQENTALIV